jgi:hypothetical protein
MRSNSKHPFSLTGEKAAVSKNDVRGPTFVAILEIGWASGMVMGRAARCCGSIELKFGNLWRSKQLNSTRHDSCSVGSN